MSDQPLQLDDADFAEDAPPGYLSQQDKRRYVPWMAALLIAMVAGQIVVPLIIGIASFVLAIRQTTFQGVGTTQHTRMTAWRDAFWYPSVGHSGGNFRQGCRLIAVDDKGKPTPHPPIDVDIQPEFLLADGDRLWAISHNEVAEIYADGSRPVVMFPSRYLTKVSPPFIYEGKPAVVDQQETRGAWALYRFDNGEWEKHLDLDLPSFAAGQMLDGKNEDTPADASLPENFATLEQQRDVAEAFIDGDLNEIDSVQVVLAKDGWHVVFSHAGEFHHRAGIPVAGSTDSGSSWDKFEVRSDHNVAIGYARAVGSGRESNSWKLTVVQGAPAVILLAHNVNQLQTELWRPDDGQWQRTATKQFNGWDVNSEMAAFTTPDGSRSFAVVSGFGDELLELHPNKIEKRASLGGPQAFDNPLEGHEWVNWAVSGFTYGLLLIVILLATWLMRRHRDPNYYKGRVPVEYASVFRRACAVAIDTLICWGPVYAGWYYWSGQTEMTTFEFIQMIDTDPVGMRDFLLELVPWLTGLLGWLLVCEVLEWLLLSLCGCTIGKFLCGVRVTQTNLERPGLLRGLARNLLSWIELPILSGAIGLAFVAFTQNRQRVADCVAGTIVLNAKSLKQVRAELAGR